MNPVTSIQPRSRVSLLSDQDFYLFNEGSHYRIYEKLGAHPMTVDGQAGTCFGVWAPNAREVSVIGDFNGWDGKTHKLKPRGDSGIWEGFLPGITKGTLYKYRIASQHHGYVGEKADPVGILYEKPPRTASVVWDLDYEWADGDWMKGRAGRQTI